MATKLTRRIVDEAKPAARPIEKRDADVGGLLLRIQPSGVKTFYVELTRGVRIKLGRHADIRMTLRYSHLAPEHKAAAVEKLVR